ncbi:hypothetical protein HYH03_015547 [Edaphochlamys debaryana]|uniref:Uncharacterized protein n=1 Tax=Edaphochlamys debaryana TaxID=47281 RepID=A0A835XMY6_9CHLO|nr:hypothetical protein HYH03_015547 [Edaphochlamys debaryana]|eukprot:KAG2485738.1 hypothetical protein HYH03_015547 [Edaphochlamys debaryana]
MSDSDNNSSSDPGSDSDPNSGSEDRAAERRAVALRNQGILRSNLTIASDEAKQRYPDLRIESDNSVPHEIRAIATFFKTRARANYVLVEGSKSVCGDDDALKTEVRPLHDKGDEQVRHFDTVFAGFELGGECTAQQLRVVTEYTDSVSSLARNPTSKVRSGEVRLFEVMDKKRKLALDLVKEKTGVSPLAEYVQEAPPPPPAPADNRRPRGSRGGASRPYQQQQQQQPGMGGSMGGGLGGGMGGGMGGGRGSGAAGGRGRGRGWAH